MNISVRLPSSPIKIWGKSVEGFLSYDRTNKHTNRYYNFIFIDILAKSFILQIIFNNKYTLYFKVKDTHIFAFGSFGWLEEFAMNFNCIITISLQTMNSDGYNTLSLKYQRFTLLVCKDISFIWVFGKNSILFGILNPIKLISYCLRLFLVVQKALF